MKKISIFLLSLGIFLFFGCGPKKYYDIETDPMIIDLNEEIGNLTTEHNQLEEEVKKLDQALKKPEFDFEMKNSIKTELHSTRGWIKHIFELIAYRKIKKKQRFKTLYEREASQKDHSVISIKESKDYFKDKEINPLKEGWKSRYKSAIDL